MAIMDNYNKLIDYGVGKHNRHIARERVEITALYFGAILANACNYKTYNIDKDELENVNFYSLVLIPSAGGKNFVRDVMQKPFDKIISSMPNVIKKISTEGFNIPVEYEKKAPKDYFVGIQSSDIGIYIASLFISEAQIGSLNIEIDELGDHIGKQNALNMLKEAYDGKIMARLIQGDAGTESRKSIYGIPTNMLAYGTSVGINDTKDKMDIFKNIIQSGMYRRSIIYHEDVAKSYKKDVENINIDDLIEAYSIMPIGKSLISKDDLSIKNAFNIIEFTSKSLLLLSEFEDSLLDKRNENIYDDLIPLDEHSYVMVKKIASIIAILDLQDKIEAEHTKYAIELFNKTRDTVKAIFNNVMEFELIYKLLLNSPEPIYKVDIMKKLNLSNRSYEQNIDLLKEYALRHNKLLTIAGSSLQKLSIEDISSNELDKIVVSVPSETGKKEKAINFTPYEVSFFKNDNGTNTIEDLIVSPNVDSFCLAHFEPSKQAPNGHRRQDNFISGQNCIAFDVDDGLDLNIAKKLLDGYVYIIYTTKSHQVEKNGSICDRYRIVMPTSTMFYCTYEEHKYMYDEIASFLGLSCYDKATRNVSRIWYVNKDAEVYVNRKGIMIDATMFINENEKFKSIKEISVRVDNENVATNDIRVNGFIKYIISNVTVGNRNQEIYKFIEFMKDINVEYSDIERNVIYVNSMLSEPLEETEINTLLRRA